ncbi:hypothetical protein TSTA_108360 [Talaromyces stipitatus ATCC 10500]|uniref:Uncharacterized protein n=1 Tax=Talaromyces stipitatus (strain ATCC 10500 / CBS 375.48 / QM 6759 / NRRL 1006) TaxID=441959 RepID=B8MUI1_TALSN|nr:uncharacterized protein TSTA_108360 [Talaromyces stipitatus ATCC 10500]EED11649.1 hypothetical protein TSTA_108360 [Talaromyces stipitatus ATCC 10500]
MLKHAQGNTGKLHIFRISALTREQYICDAFLRVKKPSTWYESNIMALENSLNQKEITTRFAVVPLGYGWYLACPQTRDITRVIVSHYRAKLFDDSEKTHPFSEYVEGHPGTGLKAQIEWQMSVGNAIQISRITAKKKEWLDWMEDVYQGMKLSLEATKSRERQAAGDIADVSLPQLGNQGFSDSYTPYWITEEEANIKDLFTKNGIGLADAPYIIQLEHGVLVKLNRSEKLQQLFSENIHEAFDKESSLICLCGYEGSLSIVLDRYKKYLSSQRDSVKSWISA